MGNLRRFLTVYYVPELSLLLAAIGAKLIGPHATVAYRSVSRPSLVNGLRGMTLEYISLGTTYFQQDVLSVYMSSQGFTK